MMTTIEQMKKRADMLAGMTLAQVRSLVQTYQVDTNLATALAAEMETHFLPDASREDRIAVFLAGLMANLVEGD